MRKLDERHHLQKIPDALDLVAQAQAYRIEYNTIRPHEAVSWNRPLDVHTGLADPTTPNWETKKILPSA